MEYLRVEEAQERDGLRLVLTASVPGPFSEAAKALFRHHHVDFLPVRQIGGRENPELVAWTRHRNAPIALYNDEAPRVRWLEILDLAERLGNGASRTMTLMRSLRNSNRRICVAGGEPGFQPDSSGKRSFIIESKNATSCAMPASMNPGLLKTGICCFITHINYWKGV